MSWEEFCAMLCGTPLSLFSHFPSCYFFRFRGSRCLGILSSLRSSSSWSTSSKFSCDRKFEDLRLEMTCSEWRMIISNKMSFLDSVNSSKGFKSCKLSRDDHHVFLEIEWVEILPADDRNPFPLHFSPEVELVLRRKRSIFNDEIKNDVLSWKKWRSSWKLMWKNCLSFDVVFLVWLHPWKNKLPGGERKGMGL